MGNQRRSIPLPSPKEQKPIYYVSRALADNIPEDPAHHESSKQEWWTLRVDGASRSSGSGVGLYYSPQLGNIWSKPSGWDSLPLTMKQNMRPSCPDWTSPLLYPSPNSGSTATHNSCNSPNGQSKKSSELTIGALTLGRHSCLPPYQRSHSIAHTCATNPLSQKFPLQPLRQPSGRQEWTYDIRIYPDRNSTRRSNRHKVRVQAARFTLIGGHLYKRSFTGPYLRCLGHSEAQYVLAELHEGICGNHSGGRSLAHRAHSQGYYWPTMKKDAAAYVKSVINVKADNGPQFDSIAFRNFCSELNIRNSYSTPRYPQRKWVEELPGVLWAYRTTPGRPTGNSFRLAYGMDAVIPTEIGLPTIRTDAAKQEMQTRN
ncbi:hypothetical protein CK203_090003 [Vitis vinifera]|uniref:Integrase zinc-binding domain-containing protein n=1 Tax=Vitis vinifera TaxID=29760 RepID=A0A438BSG0_VITVI|nr:hypothetical protein CK203_090003 [Vitis vinifera]